MAVNCFVVPSAILGLVGVTSIDTSVAGVTVSVVLPEIVPDIALTAVEPAATGVARPLEPAVLLTVATAAADEVQVTDAVRSCWSCSNKSRWPLTASSYQTRYSGWSALPR